LFADAGALRLVRVTAGGLARCVPWLARWRCGIAFLAFRAGAAHIVLLRPVAVAETLFDGATEVTQGATEVTQQPADSGRRRREAHRRCHAHPHVSLRVTPRRPAIGAGERC
jgi:hypothetical protein